MPVQIGSTAHSFANPTGLLSDCHRRVEMFIGSLKVVADTSGQELTQETRRSLDLALRYFRDAAPKHTADEEESLFPRLRQLANPEVKAALDRMDALESDHRWAEPLHSEVERLGGKYLDQGRLSPDDAQVFRDPSISFTACIGATSRWKTGRCSPSPIACCPRTGRRRLPGRWRREGV